MLTKTVKALYKDDLRRLSIDIEHIDYEGLRKKLQSTFQLESEFAIKYTDTDGDFCTIGSREDLDDLANDISGDVLLELTHDTLKDMGVGSTGKRIRLLKMIAELRLYVADLAMQESTSKIAKEGPNGEPLLDEPRVFGGMALH
ncbi:hypothetical protein DFQ26_000868 [Actinomortierella ambigua]|nr:hypothetical protein DFQ26_000868 [Actinomortierella ambigua]